jgi:hypothetical protein
MKNKYEQSVVSLGDWNVSLVNDEDMGIYLYICLTKADIGIRLK